MHGARAWIPLQWQARGHGSELISCATVLPSGSPGMLWKFTTIPSPGDTTRMSRPRSAHHLWFAAQFGICQARDLTRGSSWAWGPRQSLCQMLVQVYWLRSSLGIILHLSTPPVLQDRWEIWGLGVTLNTKSVTAMLGENNDQWSSWK